MAQYEGTIIVVSHNRFFVNSFVNKVLEIRDGRATLYLGNVDDYLAAGKQQEEQDGQERQSVVQKKPEIDSGDRKAQRRERAQKRQKLSGKLKPWKKKAAEAEKQIEPLEQRKSELEAMMADPELYADQQKWSATSKEYNEVKRRLERQYEQWEQAQEKVEEIEAQI
jgi:ATP-binding cassette subfamily F protein 3